MNEYAVSGPAGITQTSGIEHKRSPLSVNETVNRFVDAARAAGAKVFDVIDHSGEAQHVGLTLRETKLVIFGNPLGGTPAMAASPLTAIDLPLKVLIWEDQEGSVWMSYLIPEWLAERHGLDQQLVAPFSAVEKLTAAVAR